jgi:hypothetical protein
VIHRDLMVGAVLILRHVSTGRLGLVLSWSCLAVVTILLLAGPAHAAGWRIVTSPGDGQLNAVSCTSGSACTAVGVQGIYPYGPGTVLAERWNGVVWVVQPIAPPAGGQSEWTDVSCGSPRFCVALGMVVYSSSFTGRFRSIRGMWNGSRWSVRLLPKGTFDLSSEASCTSRRFCLMTAFGPPHAGRPVRRTQVWNGSRWSTTGAAKHIATSGPIWCGSARSCVTIDGAVSERWNGHAWSVMGRMPADVGPQGGYGFSAVSCASQRLCVAIGSETAGGDAPSTPIVERWNGARWSTQPAAVQPYQDEVNGVSCSRLVRCTIVGAIAPAGAGSGVPSRTLAEQWRGVTWTRQPTPDVPPDDSLSGISCVARSCIAVGWAFTGPDSAQTLVEQSP